VGGGGDVRDIVTKCHKGEGRRLAQVSRAILSKILYHIFYFDQLFEWKKSTFLKNQNVTSHRGRREGTRAEPLSPNNTWGRGEV